MITTQEELDAAPLRTWLDLGPGVFIVRKDQWVCALAGSEVYAYAGSQVNALDGSVVDALVGSEVNAFAGSEVHAYNGSRVDDWDPEKGWVERSVRRSRVEGEG